MHSIPFWTQNCLKCMPKLFQNSPWGPQNGVIGAQSAPDGGTWTLGAPMCAQREVKTARWSQERPQGAPGDLQRGPREPKRSQDEPKGSPRGAQSERKRFKRGEGGCQRGPKHDKHDCSKSLKNHWFVYQKLQSGSQF